MTKRKTGRYWVFAFDTYYPSGGVEDFEFSFNNIEEFEEEIINCNFYDSYQVLDTKTHFHVEGDIGTVTTWVCKNIGGENYDGVK